MMLLAQHTGTTRPSDTTTFKSKKAMILLSREVKAIEKVLKVAKTILAIIGGLKFRLKLKFLKI